MSTQDQIRMIEAAYNSERELGGPDCPPVRYPEYVLLQVVKEQQERIEKLERQVARLVECMPSAGERLPPDWIENLMDQDARRAERHKRNFEEIAKLEGKTIEQVERDLCKKDGK